MEQGLGADCAMVTMRPPVGMGKLRHGNARFASASARTISILAMRALPGVNAGMRIQHCTAVIVLFLCLTVKAAEGENDWAKGVQLPKSEKAEALFDGTS